MKNKISMIILDKSDIIGLAIAYIGVFLIAVKFIHIVANGGVIG